VVRGPNGQRPIPGLGEGIRTARRQARLSQADLADELGIRQSSVGQWERGATTPTLVIFHRMVAVIGPWPLLEVLLPADQADTATAETTAPQAGPPDPQELAPLVAQGLSDRQIGQRYGVQARVVTQWRQAAGLSPATPPGRPSPQELAGLFDQGLSDRQIGQRYGVAAGTVRLWRYDAELLRYHPSKQPSPQMLAQLVGEGISDRVIGQRYGKAAQTVRRWRLDDELVRTPPPPTVDAARVQELRGQGLPIPDVAAQLGYTPSQASRASPEAKTTSPQDTPRPGSAGPGSIEGGEADPQGRR
jgi:transposase/DNA-binding XRE family transcriptional regulator